MEARKVMSKQYAWVHRAYDHDLWIGVRDTQRDWWGWHVETPIDKEVARGMERTLKEAKRVALGVALLRRNRNV